MGDQYFFPNRNDTFVQAIGERHDIEIIFLLSPSEDEEGAYYIFNGYPIKGLGMIEVSITHSNKIWAVEIMQHIEDYIKIIKIENSKFLYSLFNNRSKIGRICEKIFDLSMIIPAIVVLVKNDTLSKAGILKLAAFSALLFVISNIISYPVGKGVFNLLSKLQQKSYININDYSNQIYLKEQGKKRYILLFFTLILIPILINVISAYISKKIGI